MDTASLDAALSAIGATDFKESIAPDWDAAMAAMPKDRIPFLTRDSITESCEWCGIDNAMLPELLVAAEELHDDSPGRDWIWYCYWRIFVMHQELWPAPRPPSPGISNLLLGLAAVEPFRNYHESLGIPEKVTRDTCKQIRCYADNWSRGHNGETGLYLNQLVYLGMYLNTPYIRLGRMEYQCQEYTRCIIRVFRNRETGATVAFAEDGVCYDHQGIVATDETETKLTATLVVDDTTVTGYRVSPHGMVTDEQISLSLDLWECVLQKGDQVLNMHIPSGGSMTPEACGESFKYAADFFSTHLPDFNPKIVVSASWLFNTQLEKILKPDSNLLKYQRELYLFPTRTYPNDGLWFIFLQDNFDPATAPRDTSLQRSILDFIEAGNTWRGGGMFFVLDDAMHYGTQHYRKISPPPQE